MRPGDILENAIWLTGTEMPDLIQRYKDECGESLRTAAADAGFLMAPIIWTEKRPGDERVPTVPDHIQGPDVRLLVAEAKVLCRAPIINSNSFLLDLDHKDLGRLREITRRQHAKSCPGAVSLTDQQCDAIIEEIGPQAAYDVVRNAVDTRTLH